MYVKVEYIACAQPYKKPAQPKMKTLKNIIISPTENGNFLESLIDKIKGLIK